MTVVNLTNKILRSANLIKVLIHEGRAVNVVILLTEFDTQSVLIRRSTGDAGLYGEFMLPGTNKKVRLRLSEGLYILIENILCR